VGKGKRRQGECKVKVKLVNSCYAVVIGWDDDGWMGTLLGISGV